MRRRKRITSLRLITDVLDLSKRRFLRRVGSTGLIAYLCSNNLAFGNWLSGSLARADELGALDSHGAKAMLTMARHLYPHDHLGDEYYWAVVKGIDKEMTDDPELRTRIANGFETMGSEAGIEFLELDADAQIAAMQQLEATPFFTYMLEKTTLYFYNNPEVWPHFGYQGSSWEKGGYIDRGFDDADWIPDS